MPVNSNKSNLQKYFTAEGPSPYKGNGKLVFDAFKAKVITPNGNGIRHELKTKKNQRVALNKMNDQMSSTITPDMSPGSRSIFAQYHGGGKGVPMKMYLSDHNEKGGLDGKKKNGIFDIMLQWKNKGGKEQNANLGKVKNGNPFNFKVQNSPSGMNVGVGGKSKRINVGNASKSYFKFGNYLQTQDPDTKKRQKPNKGGLGLLKKANINKSKITFSNTKYKR